MISWCSLQVHAPTSPRFRAANCVAVRFEVDSFPRSSPSTRSVSRDWSLAAARIDSIVTLEAWLGGCGIGFAFMRETGESSASG